MERLSTDLLTCRFVFHFQQLVKLSALYTGHHVVAAVIVLQTSQHHFSFRAMTFAQQVATWKKNESEENRRGNL
jgi:hypothetical protein